MKIKYVIRVILTVIWCIAPVVYSVGQYWNLKRIDSDHGLSNSAITTIFQDSNDYVWFGTWDGLNKYDGSNIQVYKLDVIAKKSISNNVIRTLIEDKEKNLWIVTDKGMNRYNPDYDNFDVFFHETIEYSGREKSIKSSLSPDSTLWCGIYGAGIYFFSCSDNQFFKINHEQYLDDYIKGITGIAALSNEKLIFLTDRGELLEIEKKGSWVLSKKINLLEAYNIVPNANWFFNDGENLLLFISLDKGGILIYNISNGQLEVLNSGEDNLLVTTVSKSSSKHTFWIGTDGGKILKLNTQGKYVLKDLDQEFPDLIKNKIKIWSIYESLPNLLWVGTDGNGVFEYNTEGSAFISVQKGNPANGQLGHNIVRAIYENERGELWVGTRGNGLNILNPSLTHTKVINAENGLSNNAVLSINRDLNKNYWIGMDGEGVDMIENISGKIFHFPRDFNLKPDINFRSVYSICIDSYGDIWLGTSGFGIIKLVVKKLINGTYDLELHEQYQNIAQDSTSLNSNIVYSIIEDHTNALWVGSRGGGLQKLNTITKKFESINEKIDKDIISLKKGMKDELWIGTSNGLYLLDASSENYRISYFNELDGLPNNTIHGILKDSLSNIWVSTNKGLSKWDREQGVFKNYTKNDGLQSNEYSDGAAIKGILSGKLYFGGINGITMFHSSNVKESNNFPTLVIQGLKLFNKSVKPGDGSGLLNSSIDNTDTLILNHDQNFFSINFTVLNYHNKEKCEYAYYLENFDKEWNFVGQQNSASFTNVPHGNYQLQIKYTNEDRIWSKVPRKLFVIIKPPFWQTWWAYLIYVLLILLSFLAVIVIFKKRSAAKRRLFIERLERAKAEEINDYKLRFFTNITHEFRTPLSLILVPATQLFEKRNLFPEQSHLFSNIYENANRLLRLIGELIEFRKAETGNIPLSVQYVDINKFARNITKIFEQYAEQHYMHISFTSHLEEMNVWFDQEKIEKIMLNLISNAIKYSHPNGKIKVETEKLNGQVLIKISDTGIGMSKDILGKIFDRFYNYQSDEHYLVEEMKSSGVGLALTKSLVELHKGSIDVESTPGIGSTFSVILPSEKSDYLEYISEKPLSINLDGISHKIEAELKEIKSFTPKKIKREDRPEHDATLLIIDDNAELRNLITEVVGINYNIIEASNGMEGLKILQESSIDLVISDVIMPEINGFELCRRIKEDINTSHIPVILLTAMGDMENRIKGIKIGADSYIPKPFHPRHLLTRISKLLEAREQLRATFREAPWKLESNVHGLVNKDKIWVTDFTGFIRENIHLSSLDSGLLTDRFAMSKTQLYRKAKALTGFAPHAYIKHARLIKASGLLKKTNKTVSEIIYETGFNNRTYFYSSFKEEFNCSPTEFRNKIEIERLYRPEIG